MSIAVPNDGWIVSGMEPRRWLLLAQSALGATAWKDHPDYAVNLIAGYLKDAYEIGLKHGKEFPKEKRGGG